MGWKLRYFWLALIVALVSCKASNEDRQAGVLRRGLSGEPSTLDPAEAADTFSNEVIRDLYEGLVAEGPNGEVVPGVAESWTHDDIGKQYSFVLRADARWSNGRPVRAQDFVFAWQRELDPKRASPIVDNLRLLAGAENIITGHSPVSDLGAVAQSDRVLTVCLDTASLYFPQMLTHSAFFPVFSEVSAASRKSITWISNGPYILSSWLPGSALNLATNPYYWNKAKVHIKLVQYQIATEDSQYLRYRARQLDLTDTVPVSALPSLMAARSSELRISPFLATAYYGLNMSSGPLAREPKLRQALSMAVDRTRLVKALGFGQTPAFSFVPPGTWSYTPQQLSWKELRNVDRIAESRKLYEESGYSPTNPLHIRLLLNSDAGVKNTAIIVASMWHETLGVETQIADEEYRVFLQSRHDKARWDVVRLGWTADYNDAGNFLDVLRSGSGNNDPGFSDVTFDSLMDQTSHTSDFVVRRQLLQAAEREMLEHYPVIPLYFFVSKRLIKPYLLGASTSNPLNRVNSSLMSFQPEAK